MAAAVIAPERNLKRRYFLSLRYDGLCTLSYSPTDFSANLFLKQARSRSWRRRSPLTPQIRLVGHGDDVTDDRRKVSMSNIERLIAENEAWLDARSLREKLLGYEPLLTGYALASAFVTAAVWATTWIADRYAMWLTAPVILAIWTYALWNVRLLTRRVSSRRAEMNDSWLVKAGDHELFMEIPPEPEERHLFYTDLIARSPEELMKENGHHYNGFTIFIE